MTECINVYKKFIKDNKKIYYKIKYIKRYYCDR